MLSSYAVSINNQDLLAHSTIPQSKQVLLDLFHVGQSSRRVLRYCGHGVLNIFALVKLVLWPKCQSFFQFRQITHLAIFLQSVFCLIPPSSVSALRTRLMYFEELKVITLLMAIFAIGFVDVSYDSPRYFGSLLLQFFQLSPIICGVDDSLCFHIFLLDDNLTIRIVFFCLLPFLFVFLANRCYETIYVVTSLFAEIVAQELIGSFSDILPHFDKLPYSNVVTAHEPKACLNGIREGKVVQIIQHASGCIFFILLYFIGALL